MLALALSACYAAQPTPDQGSSKSSYLELAVEPRSAQIFIDDQYEGIVAGWREQVVPIAPGPRRLELRAQGYITQRFDLDVGEDSWLTLSVKLEPRIDAPGGPADAGDSDEAGEGNSSFPEGEDRDRGIDGPPMPGHPAAPTDEPSDDEPSSHEP